MALLGFLVELTRKPVLSGRDQTYLEGAACFWRMVDLLWIVICPLLYLVR